MCEICTSLRMHWRVFIYPIGLLRIIQTILAIVAIVCTTKHSGEVSIKFDCPDINGTIKGNDHLPIESFTWNYPYDLINEPKVPLHPCNETSSERQQIFFISLKVEAQFFVFLSTITIIVSIIWLLIYLIRWPFYDADPRLPLMDCTGSAAFMAFWLTSTSAWFTAVSVMKSYLSEKSILSSLPMCHGEKNTCTVNRYNDNFNNLNFSLICGAIIFVLWSFSTVLIYRKVRRLKSENERYQYGSATVADAFSSSTTTPNILQ